MMYIHLRMMLSQGKRDRIYAEKNGEEGNNVCDGKTSYEVSNVLFVIIPILYLFLSPSLCRSVSVSLSNVLRVSE